VLVFGNGAVIRLSAAVAVGQLLFLTNKKTGKEVVTQVRRKRSFRPTSCYVDLEFTEPCPGFWGIEFPKTAVASLATANLSKSDEDSPASPAPVAPDHREVEKLKNEVAELQHKLKSLTSGQGSASTPDAPIVAESVANEEALKLQQEQTALQQLLAQEAQQEQLHGPKRLVGYTRRSTASAVVKEAGKIATAGAFAAVIVSAGIAAYRFGLFNSVIGKTAKAASSQPVSPAIPQKGPMAVSAGAYPVPTASLSGATAEAKPIAAHKAVNVAAASQPSVVVPEPSIVNSVKPSSAANTNPAPPAPTASARKRSTGSTAGVASISAAPSSKAASPSLPAASGRESIKADEYVAPKLVRAVKPVSPPDALRNYVTGDVVVDALVDATGHVKSVTVVSGPAKLRSTAIDVMKQYLYEPAKKDGRAVPSHVETSLQFWYEP
jgi:hypothetical protein